MVSIFQFGKRYSTIILLGSIIIVAIFLRTWQLQSIPPGFGLDEAAYANDALETAETGQYAAFYPDNTGREGLFIIIVSAVFQLFDSGIWQLRIVSACAGILTVLGVFVLARKLTHVIPIALLSTFFIAVSFWPIVMSRIGFRATLTPLFIVWLGILYLYAKEKKSIGLYVACGILLGLGLYTYLAFRMVIVLMILYSSVEIFLSPKKERAKTLQRWFALFVAAGIMVFPLALYFLYHPLDSINRAMSISIIFSDHPVQSFLINIIKTFGMFNIQGDPLWIHNIAHASLLLLPVGILFLVGLAIIAFNKHQLPQKRFIRFFLYTWLCIMLLPSMITNEHIPSALRSIGAMPVVYIFIGIGAWYSYMYIQKKLKKKWKAIFITGSLLFLIVIGGIEYYRYFIFWANTKGTACQYIAYHTRIAEQLRTLPQGTTAYIIVDVPGLQLDGFSLAAQSLLFLTHGNPNVVFLHEEEVATVPMMPNDRVISILQVEQEQVCERNE